MSETPRSDEQQEDARNTALYFDCRPHPSESDAPPIVVPIDFARTLERELAQAREEREKVEARERFLLLASEKLALSLADRDSLIAELVEVLKISQARIETASGMFCDKDWNLGCADDLSQIWKALSRASVLSKADLGK